MTFVATISLSIPLLVTLVVCIVARREGTAIPTGALARLVIATIAAVVGSFFFAHPVAIAAAALALFVILAIPVMQMLERDAIERLVDEPVRSAGLVPRTVGTFVPLAARSGTIAAGLGLLCWALLRVVSNPALMGFGLIVSGVTFFFLYESWMRDEVFSVRAASETERRARVRAVFWLQTVLSLSLLVLAGLSAGGWPGLIAVIAIAGPLGAIGCAFALSTGIQKRYLQAGSVRG